MPIRFQSSLGRVKTEQRSDKDMGGVLLYGKVTRVYPQMHTADVVIMNNQYGSLTSSGFNNGKYACRILESYAGYDSEKKLSYGKVTPIQVGNYVLVGFINNYKSQPVILGCFHSPEEAKNVLSNDLDRSVIVSKLQDYWLYNKDGGFEIVHHSGAFVKGTKEDINDELNSITHEDMKLVKDNIVKKSDYSKPLSILLLMKNSMQGFMKLFINGKKNIIRLSRSTNEKDGTFIEIPEDGSFRIRLQQDSSELDGGRNVVDFKLNMKTCGVEIVQKIGVVQNIINVSPSGGINITAGVNVSITSNKNIDIRSSSTVTLDADSVNIFVKE